MIKKAFTLAEVLLAITIIGVLASILIPSLQNATPKSNRIAFKKAYYALSKAVNNMINDEENYPSDMMGTSYDNASLKVPRGFNYTTATSNGSVNKFCYFLTQQLNTAGDVYCPPSTGGSSSWAAASRGHFTTTDGMYWMLYFRNSDEDPDTQFPLTAVPESAAGVYPVMVTINVNGTTKGPNCTATTGTYPGLTSTVCASTADCSSNPDTFVIDVRYDGKLHVGGYHGTAHTDACANQILSNPTVNR